MGTGVYWASVSSLRSMIYEITDMPAGALDGDVANFPQTSGYVEDVMDALGITFGGGAYGVWELDGLTSTAAAGPGGPTGTEVDMATLKFYNSPRPDTLEGFHVEYPSSDQVDQEIGAYFYRVPEPDTAGLFAAGLLVAGFASRRRK
jgi:hypothetical protein